MMKFSRLLVLLLALTLLCSAALAEPRYPARQQYGADAAAAFSSSTLRDLNKICEELEEEINVELHVAAVDFLDGVSITAYGEGLRSKWDLGSKDVLLLLAVGEDQFGLFGGDDFNEKLPVSTQQKLLSACLHTPFMAQDYDGALRAFIPALVEECAKAWNEDLDVGGLLGAPQTTAEPFSVERWFLQQVEPEPEPERRITDEDEDTGLSLGKLILTIFLLSVIFGKKKHRRRSGCGCMPFSSILAALGLWKLWDKD